MLLQRDACTHTQRKLLHANTCVQGWFYTEELYTHTQMPLQTEMLLQRNAFKRRTFTYRCLYFTWFPTADTHFARKSSESRCKTAISPIETQFVLKGCTSTSTIEISLVFNDQNTFSARGSTQSHPNAKNRTFTSVLTIETHLVWEGPYTEDHRNPKIASSLQSVRIQTRLPTLQFHLNFGQSKCERVGVAFWGINPRCPAAIGSPPASLHLSLYTCIYQRVGVFKKLTCTGAIYLPQYTCIHLHILMW